MDQARKAKFSLQINTRKLCLPINIQCDMFETLSLQYFSMVVKYGVLAVLKCLKYSIGIS